MGDHGLYREDRRHIEDEIRRTELELAKLQRMSDMEYSRTKAESMNRATNHPPNYLHDEVRQVQLSPALDRPQGYRQVEYSRHCDNKGYKHDDSSDCQKDYKPHRPPDYLHDEVRRILLSPEHKQPPHDEDLHRKHVWPLYDEGLHTKNDRHLRDDFYQEYRQVGYNQQRDSKGYDRHDSSKSEEECDPHIIQQSGSLSERQSNRHGRQYGQRNQPALSCGKPYDPYDSGQSKPEREVYEKPYDPLLSQPEREDYGKSRQWKPVRSSEESHEPGLNKPARESYGKTYNLYGKLDDHYNPEQSKLAKETHGNPYACQHKPEKEVYGKPFDPYNPWQNKTAKEEYGKAYDSSQRKLRLTSERSCDPGHSKPTRESYGKPYDPHNPVKNILGKPDDTYIPEQSKPAKEVYGKLIDPYNPGQNKPSKEACEKLYGPEQSKPAKEAYGMPYDAGQSKPAKEACGKPCDARKMTPVRGASRNLHNPGHSKLDLSNTGQRIPATVISEPSQPKLPVLKSIPIKQQLEKYNCKIQNRDKLVIELEGLHGLMKGGIKHATSENKILTDVLMLKAKELLYNKESAFYKKTELSESEPINNVIKEESSPGESKETTETMKMGSEKTMMAPGIGRDVEMTDSSSTKVGSHIQHIPQVDKNVEEVLVDLFTNLHSKNKSVAHDLLMEQVDVNGQIDYLSEGLLCTHQEAAAIISKLLEKPYGIDTDCKSEYYQLLNIISKKEHPRQETSIQCNISQSNTPVVETPHIASPINSERTKTIVGEDVNKIVKQVEKENLKVNVASFRLLLADLLKGAESKKGNMSAGPDLFGKRDTLMTMSTAADVPTPTGEEVTDKKPAAPISPIFGMVYPPPIVKNIVDKMAGFVAKNGPIFEEKIRQTRSNDPKFKFVNIEDPYYAYYQHKIKEFQQNSVCIKCKKVGHLCNNCPQDNKKVCCVVCHEVGHVADNCPNRVCIKCKKVGHLDNNCPQDNKKVCCVVCHEVSHATDVCPNRVCAQCKQKGHCPGDCPNTKCMMTKCKSLDHTMRDCPNKVKKTEGSDTSVDRVKQHSTQVLENQEIKKAKKAEEPQLAQNINSKHPTPVKIMPVSPAKAAPKACSKCGNAGHSIAECPNQVCAQCKQKGHCPGDCPNTKCMMTKCKGFDHTMRDCPNKVKKTVVSDTSVDRVKQHSTQVLENQEIKKAKKTEEPQLAQNINPKHPTPVKITPVSPAKAAPKACSKCGDAGHFIAECPNQVCAQCKRKGHCPGDCPNTKCMMTKCKGLDHTMRDCPNKGKNTVGSDASVDRAKRHSTQVLENQGIKIAKITEEPQLAQNIHPKHPTPVKISPVSPTKAAPKVCFKCNESGHLSNDCPICSKCGDAGHFIDECPNQVCSLCKQKGHIGKSCCNKDAVCSNCKQTGHWVRECTTTICNECKQNGHLYTNCPNTICVTCTGSFHSRRNCPIKACTTCNQMDHYTNDCPNTNRLRTEHKDLDHIITQNRGKRACRLCKEPGHNIKECPNTKCVRLPCKGSDHTIRDCPNQVCIKCREVGHVHWNCPHDDTKVFCLICRVTDHDKEDCPKRACTRCKQTGHCGNECPNTKCLKPKCKNLDHTPRDCPNKACRLCNEKGHYTKDCTNAKCVRNSCKDLVHTIRGCPNQVCPQCKEKGHCASDCPNTKCLMTKCKDLDHTLRDCPNKVTNSVGSDASVDNGNQHSTLILENKEIKQSKITDEPQLVQNIIQKQATPLKTHSVPPPKEVLKVSNDASIDHGKRHTAQDLGNQEIKKAKITEEPQLSENIILKHGTLPTTHPVPPQKEAVKVCFKCEESGHLSKDCPICTKCGDAGHFMDECPNKVCSLCKQKGHIGKSCCNKDAVCSNCKQTGHWAKECPEGFCSQCKQKGHFLTDCPNTVCFTCTGSVHSRRNCPIKECLVTNSAANDTSVDLGNKEIQPAKITEPQMVQKIIQKQAIPLKVQSVSPPKKVLTVAENVCFKCSEAGHLSKDCPICSKCGDAGHFTDECPNKVCSLCKQKGHIGTNCCNEDVTCSNCQQRGHRARECLETVCHQCKQKGHVLADCPTAICFTCTGSIHSRRNCPINVCSKCKNTGHSSSNCPFDIKGKVCERCNKPGHSKIYCSAKVCYKCKKEGHLSLDCPSEVKKVGQNAKLCPSSAGSKILAPATAGRPIPAPSQNAALWPARAGYPTSTPTFSVCAFCKQQGHYPSDCPNTKCLRPMCTSSFHTIRFCPNKGLFNPFPLVNLNFAPSPVRDITPVPVSTGLYNPFPLVNPNFVPSPSTVRDATPLPVSTVCAFCNQQGHFPSACPNTKCLRPICKSLYHTIKDCPMKGIPIPIPSSASVTASPVSVKNVTPSPASIRKATPSPASVRNATPVLVLTACAFCRQKDHFPSDCPNTKCIIPTCKDLDHTIRDCPNKTCSKCKKKGHLGTNCPNKEKVCLKCKEGGHLGSNCPHDDKKVHCAICKDPCHYTRDCPVRVCAKCNENGHSPSGCPNTIYSKAKGKSIDLTIRDTPKKKCNNCKANGHARTECPFGVCAECVLEEQNPSDCGPTTKCMKAACKGLFHSNGGCPNKDILITTPTTVDVVTDKQSSTPIYSKQTVIQSSGIVYPPPLIKTIVDKTAGFVAKNGSEFEAKVRKTEINNPQFNFMNPANSYYAYYQLKIKEFQRGKGVKIQHSQNARSDSYNQNARQSGHGVHVPGSSIVTVPVPKQPQKLPTQKQLPTSTSSANEPSDTVYVCNLPTPCSAAMLRDLCQVAGEVTYVAILGGNTGIVTYETIAMAEEALALLDQTDFHDSTIVVGYFKNP